MNFPLWQKIIRRFLLYIPMKNCADGTALKNILLFNYLVYLIAHYAII